MKPTDMTIGTHNSATGERPQGLLSWLGTPFARCQTKTIREQYEAGCRFYDLRVCTYGDDWYLCHGLWLSRRTLLGVLVQLSRYPERCNVILTYEGIGRIKADHTFSPILHISKTVFWSFVVIGGISLALHFIENCIYFWIKHPGKEAKK